MTPNELLTKVDAAWRPFRDAVRGLGRGRFDEPTSAGWTYRDLVAHVAAWEDRTARRIRAFHETGRQIGPEGEAALGIHDVRDTDGFNAKVASSHRLVGAEALVDELDTAHRRLTEEIARLTDDQLCADVEPTAWGPQSWVVAVVAGNSFGHYREHAEEMGIARSGEGPRG